MNVASLLGWAFVATAAIVLTSDAFRGTITLHASAGLG